MRGSKVLFVSLTVLINASAISQSHFSHQVDSVVQHSTSPVAARDFWFAVPQNYDPNDNSGKVFTIYTTSVQKATVNIQIGSQPAVKMQISPGAIWDYSLPTSVELKSSLTVEKGKGIHVWSDDADISVFFMSRNPFTSDGFMVIPSFFWDTSYVVASFSALIVDPRFDLPSECVIIAKEDNTLVHITPSQDVRKTGNHDTADLLKGETRVVMLNRGESMQLQTVFDLGGSDLDLTGTIISSNKPIGVIGASVCPFIPADPYCDHICEMLLPTSKWGRTYYTLPFFGRVVGGDSFYVIGSKENQVIYRNGNQYAVVGKFESFFRPDISEPSQWKSDAPFLLVQYLNSSRYGSTQNQGDPAMVEINPAEFGRKEVLTQIPYITPGSGQNTFKNYINILLPTAAISSLSIDGIPATQYANSRRYPISGTSWEGVRLQNVAIGAHTIKCDSPITTYAYGMATEDSYAWSVLGHEVPPIIIKDSTPPSYIISDSCDCTTIRLKDVHPNASGIVSVIADSLSNVEVTGDPTFVPNTGNDSVWYRLCGTGKFNGYAKYTITDSLGNSRSIRSVYIPSFTSLEDSTYIELTIVPGEIRCTTILITNLTGDSLRSYGARIVGTGHVNIIPDILDQLPTLEPHGSISLQLCFTTDSLGSLDTLFYSYDSCVTNFVVFKVIVEKSDVASGGKQTIDFRLLDPLIRDRAVSLAWNSPYPSTLGVFDMLGRPLYSVELPIGSEADRILLPYVLESGSYIIRFSSGRFVRSYVIRLVE